MSKWVAVIHQPSGRVLAHSVRWCASFACKLRGLMFRQALRSGEGLLLVERRASRSAMAIHMFFVPFPIAVIWLDGSFRVVDKLVARPWRPFYAPRVSAQYALEGDPALVEEVDVGDVLGFKVTEGQA